MSGGLLYGREVDRPGWVATGYGMNPSEKARREERMIELSKEGRTVTEIARETGEKWHRVHWVVRKWKSSRSEQIRNSNLEIRNKFEIGMKE